MMTLSTMWNVDRTIREDGSSVIAERILEQWDYDSGSIRFFRSSANFLYVLQREGTDHLLRFSDASERSREDVEADLDLLAWAAGEGIDVALPVPSSGGNLLETVSTDSGAFHAAVLPMIQGKQVEIEDLDTPGFHRWGAALGKLHTALQAYPGSAARRSWRDHLDFANQFLAADDQELRRELEAIQSELAALPVTGATYGLIHADFELDNLVWREDAISVLDFDDCSLHWYAADFALALGDLFDEGAGPDDERFHAFALGYSAHHALDAELASRLPLFQRLDSLVQYARLVRSTDISVGQEHPEWLRGLSQKLHDRMSGYRNSLAQSVPDCAEQEL